MLVHVGTCQHISAHISTCRHVHRYWHMPASGLGMTDRLLKWRDKCDMSAHVSTYRHISTHVGMSKCADTCQHARYVSNGWHQGCWEWFHMLANAGICRYISAHVGMSTGAYTCQHLDRVSMIAIRGVEINGTCWYMSAHVSTYRHISAHFGMSTDQHRD